MSTASFVTGNGPRRETVRNNSSSQGLRELRTSSGNARENAARVGHPSHVHRILDPRARVREDAVAERLDLAVAGAQARARESRGDTRETREARLHVVAYPDVE